MLASWRGVRTGIMADHRLDGLRVVVVEDHDDTVELVQQALRHLGATVTAVSRAREAVALTAEADIILTDYMLPEDDGVWLLEQVNQQPRPVPVLLVPGFTPEQVPRLAEANFARTILKLVDPWKLAKVIVEILRP